MALPLWIGLESSFNLKCWYCNEEQDWVQLGEIVTVQNLITPMVFSVPKNHLEFTWQRIKSEKWEQYFGPINTFYFVLKRDDSTLLPAYEVGTPSTKLMSVFGEFAESVNQLAHALGLAVVGFESLEHPGAFKMQARFSMCSNIGEVLRILALLRGGIEILSYTRGFQMSDMRWADMPIDGKLLGKLQDQLC